MSDLGNVGVLILQAEYQQNRVARRSRYIDMQIPPFAAPDHFVILVGAGRFALRSGSSNLSAQVQP